MPWLFFPSYSGADCPLCSLPRLRSLFSQLSTLVLGLEALRIARSIALNRCFLTASHTVACCSRLARLIRAHQPTIYFVPNLFSLFAAFRFEYKAHFLSAVVLGFFFLLFFGFFSVQLQILCVHACTQPSDTTEYHTPFEYQGVVNQAAAPLAGSTRFLQPNTHKRLHKELQANWQWHRSFWVSTASCLAATLNWALATGSKAMVLTMQWQFITQILLSLSLRSDSTLPAAALGLSHSYLFVFWDCPSCKGWIIDGWTDGYTDGRMDRWMVLMVARYWETCQRSRSKHVSSK